MENLKKKYLTNGMYAKDRAGNVGVVVNGLIVRDDGNFAYVNDFTDELKCSHGITNLDIIAVYNGQGFGCADNSNNIIWKERTNILDRQERKYLRRLISPFWHCVKYIVKECLSNGNAARIGIIMIDNSVIHLPTFKPDSMYVGMENRKHYTVKELELF